jgi:hypothetical protein
MMTRLNRILILVLLLVPLAFSSCESGREQEKIAVNLELDYNGLLEAIRDNSQSLSDYLDMIDDLLSSGVADNKQAMDLIRELVASMEGTAKEKLDAVAAAIKAQTTSLETKLALIEAAVSDGFADGKAQQELLLQLVSTLNGTVEEKLKAIEAAVKSQQTSLETKIGLIDAAVKSGFADSDAARSLILDAISSLGSTLEEKAALVEAAVTSQTTALSARLALIETAVENGFAGQKTAQDLIQEAVASLDGTIADKLSAIESAVNNRATTLLTKLALLEEAANAGVADRDAKLELIKQAVSSMSGTAQEKLDAILTAVSRNTTTLQTKVGLISSALESGFLADATAIQTMKQALDTSLGDLDDHLSGVKEDILDQLSAISQMVTPQELAKAFTSLMDAIDGQAQSAAEILPALQQAVTQLMEKVDIKKVMQGLVYMGNPAVPDTVSCGNDLVVRLRVNPSNVPLTENMLEIQQIDRKQFFLSGADRSQAVKNHFPNFTLEKDPEAEGQYIVRVRTLVDEVYKYWDETSLIFKCRATDEDGNPKYFSTEPVPVVIMPNPKDGLSISGRDNTATFLINDTLGIIYQPLVSVLFRDGSDTRLYTAEYLSSADFDPTNQLRVTTILDRERHFVGIQPDTTNMEPGDGWRRWDDPDPRYYGTLLLRDYTQVNHKELLGSLELTDRWGGTYSAPLSHSLAWYTSYKDTVLVDPTISSDGKLQANLASMATALGLNLGEHPGSTYCDVLFDFASASGAWLSAEFKPYSWDLEMQLMTFPSGSRFTVDAMITQTVQPNENDSSFRPKQRKVRMRVTFTVK